MEIKRIFIVLFVVILATGCTKNYTCSKEEKSNEFDYSIQMNLIFDGTKIKNVKSDIKYILTDKGMESIDNLKENLNNKKALYTQQQGVWSAYILEEWGNMMKYKKINTLSVISLILSIIALLINLCK